MDYNSKVKKFRKLDKGTYSIQNYSTGTYWFKTLIELIVSIMFFPIILIKNILIGKKKEEKNA